IGVVFRHNRDCTVILVKLCKFLAHPLNGHFKKLIPRRFLMSRTKRSRIAIIHLQKSLITNGACVRMLKAGVQMTFDQLALASPKELLEQPQSRKLNRTYRSRMGRKIPAVISDDDDSVMKIKTIL
uniref:Uncharacterized protein n=1 Tax=Astatotilapia calliptera TaxID=8154 RepID=A0A3P8RGG2_ASTCA